MIGIRKHLALSVPRARSVRRHHALRAAASLFAAGVLMSGMQGACAQAVYPTPEAAAQALVDALAGGGHAAIEHVLGRDYQRLIPAQDTGEGDVYDFLGAWSRGHQIVMDPEPGASGKSGGSGKSGARRQTAHLAVGTSGWTLPIPLLKTAHGWRFDPAAARSEIAIRRVGRNERAAMSTSLAYLGAQNDYRNLTGHYAQRLLSEPGQRDGLYWPAQPGGPQSPLGPLVAAMQQSTSAISANGYYGYHYRILTRQGSHAKGGAENYVQDGVMKKGCALVAWPVQYGATGVMTFIVNQDGQLYQKDLGPNTGRTALALKSFDPDPSWSPVQP
jgi:hypothetical protein